MEKYTYSILETAKILGISKSLCYELVNNGTIQTIQLGSKKRITRQVLSKILNENPSAIYTGNKKRGN